MTLKDRLLLIQEIIIKAENAQVITPQEMARAMSGLVQIRGILESAQG